MFKIAIENLKGERLELNEGLGYAVTGIDGLTPPTFTLNFATAGLKDGSIYNSSRAENRNIVITIKLIKNIEANRINLYKFFKVKQKLNIYFTNDTREVFIEGYMESMDGNLFENGQTIQISLLCPNPYFKALNESIGNVSSIIDLFTFPFAIEAEGISFSEIEKLTEKNVINTGDVDTGIKIELYANTSVVNPIIYDEEGGSFGLNYILQAGDVVVINTIPGEKSITLTRSGIKSSLINYVMANPTWFTLKPGDNLFTFNAASQSEQVDIIFKHYDQYVGV